MNRFQVKINSIPPIPFIVVISISLFALLMLYSIGAGSFYPWSIKQFCKLLIGIVAMVIASSINLKFWRDHAYLFYLLSFIMLVFVAISGKSAMGAQRWLNFYFFNIQPSELMRIFLVITLARYFSDISEEDTKKTLFLISPIALIASSIVLVLLQPDLGTAILLFCLGASMLFVCGVQIWKFVVALASIAALAPILWNKLYQYQQERILMFLNPEMDPNGAGYHVLQSRIALGSGGFWGKGLMNGTQGQLNFLPEKQTDFVFAALGEELGFIGCVGLIILYAILIMYNLGVSIRARSRFNQIMVFGFNAMLFFYIFVNMSMVCGLLPVVGIPLPFFSYGGSALVVLMFCQGLIFAVDFEQENKRPSLKINFSRN